MPSSVVGRQRKSQSSHPGKREKSARRIRSHTVAVPFTGQVAGVVPDTGQIMRQVARMVPTAGPVSGQILASASVPGSVIPSGQGLIMGQGLSSMNQFPVRAHILPTHQIVVKEQVRPRGQILSKGQISVTSAGPVQATNQVLGQISGQVKPVIYGPELRQVAVSTEGHVKTVGLLAGQVVAHELFPVAVVPGSVAEGRTLTEGKFQE